MRAIERPPLRTWLRYRVAGGRVPERYITWVERDIRSPWWPWLSSAPMPIAITLGMALFSDLSIVWWVAALVGGLVLTLAIQGGWPGRAYALQRTLALRYQRGEITRTEWRDLQFGKFDWRIGLLALAAAVVAFVVLILVVPSPG